ncbi:pentatricopeptide repeat-containing protein [Cocos nucifera]|uniref:Pentatricopeptide repeat-containing protein n=1 Tax=Cocos nucifera TaxID=13894 RepID=A0A8K0NCV9_COCNU|nr:pentatricopeptide repeat-containing protein [Cocos nucifera]
MMRGFFGLCQFGHRFSCVAFAAEVVGNVSYAGGFFSKYNVFCTSALCFRMHYNPSLQHLCTKTQYEGLWEGSSSATLLRKLEIALKDDGVNEAWEAFSNFRRLYGFPEQHLVSKMIILLSYSSSCHWLHKAYDLVLAVQNEKPNLLHYDPLTRLALTLLRTQMPIPASTILRIVLGNGKLPPMDIWSTLFFHLVKTQTGSYLASDILVDICEFVLHHTSNAKRFKNMNANAVKPSITIFNLVLNSCAKFGSPLKAQQIIELIPRVGVVADANTIIIIAQIYEMIGQHDELKKLKKHIDGVSSALLNRHYRQFYDCLLSLHFKYNDIDSAAELILDLCQRPKSVQSFSGLYAKSNGPQTYCMVQIGSNNLRMGYKIMVEPNQIQNDFVVDAQSYSKLVLFTDGKLVPSKRALAKLINCCVKERKVDKLSNFLINIQKNVDSKEANLCLDVMDACIQLRLLDTAHDILDNMEGAGIPIGSKTYISLLRTYCRENMLEESKVLLKQMRKVGLLVNISDEQALFQCISEESAANPCDKITATSVGKSPLVEYLDRELKEEYSKYHLTYEFNSSIQFFCQAKMIEDALKTFKRMQQRNIQPTVQTFSHLVYGYSLLKMYREITILWGDIRRRLEDGVLTVDRDLFELFLWNFLKGGYFERVLEIINYMIEQNMYIDKWKCKREFLKFHKNLYRSLKASHTRTDAQSKRLEHVRAFRRWVGID